MKRKIVRQGGTALTITLPSEWCANHNLKPGNEVEITEKGKELIVKTDSLIEFDKVAVDISGVEKMVNRILGAAYKAGYDEIEVNYYTPEQLQTIHNVLGFTCIGFEVVEQTQKRIIIRKLSTLDPEEFDKVFRRLFQSLVDMGNDCLDAVKSQSPDNLRNVALKDMIINKYADFLRRLLNKGAAPDFKKTPPIYYIVEQLERIGDRYKDMSNELAKKPIKFDRKFYELFRHINGFLKQFYELFYNFNMKSVEDFGEKRSEIQKELNSIIEKEPKDCMRYLFYLDDILENVYDSNGALITARI